MVLIMVSTGVQHSVNPSEKDNNIELGPGQKSSFNSHLSGLTPGTKYYVNAYLINEDEKGNSGTIDFTTLPEIPIVVTSFVIEFTKSSAVLGGQVASQGMSPVTDQGVYLGLSPDMGTDATKLPIENEASTFSTNVAGLTPGTNYYVKAYGTNSFGTGYGLEYSFNTGQDDTAPQVTDIDGNVYHFVKIGQQTWMAENLKVINFNDGTAIPLYTDSTVWASTSSPGYCWYNNDSSAYKKIYGSLYNWYAVNTGKLCPEGWHVPSKEEWTNLVTYLGGENIAGGKLKEAGIIHWTSPSGGITNKTNVGATNETGFTALPGGARGFRFNEGFNSIGSEGYWWSSTKSDFSADAFKVTLWFDDIRLILGPYFDQNDGFSVRCIKDN